MPLDAHDGFRSAQPVLPIDRAALFPAVAIFLLTTLRESPIKGAVSITAQ
jgi:hypothetical protein